MNINKLKYFGLVLLLIIPAIKFLFIPNEYWNMHDDMQIVRQLEIEKCLFDGQIPCRWVPDLGYGYGYPLFNYYPPLPYFIGEIFRLTGLNFTTTIKVVAIFQFIIASIGMFILGTSLFGYFGGLISSVFYAYAPYHAVNIYIRGAMNEAWAAVFFPYILYCSRRMIQQPNYKNFIGLTLSISGLMLSHNPMLLIFSPFIVIWCLFWIYQKRLVNIKKYLSDIILLSLVAVLSLGLSAFFTLPVIFENNLVQIDSMFTNYYTYAIHFVSLKQLFISNFWGDGPSVWGVKDGFSMAIGYLYWIIPLFAFTTLIIKKLRKAKLDTIDYAVLFVILFGLVSLFMSHERSTFIWKMFPTVQKIQFPWRFLNIATFFTSTTVGYLAVIFRKFKYNKVLFLCLLIFQIVVSIPYFTPVTHGPVTDSQKLSGISWRNQVTGGIYDYLPKTASTAPKEAAKEFIDQIIPASSIYQVSGQKKGTDWMFFNITLSQPSTIYLAQLYFPQFIVTVNGTNVSPQIEPILGRISLNLNAGQNQVYLKLHNTPIRSIANTFTLFSIIILILVPYVWKKLTLLR